MSNFFSAQNIKDHWSIIYRKVIIFLSRKSSKEVMTFLVFVCVSALFWFLQSVYEEADGSFKIELIIKDMPSNVVFTTAIPSDIKVNVHDKNFQLLRYYYSKNFDTLEIDFHRYIDENGNFRISAVDLLSILQNQLESGTQITSITPALIDAKYAYTEGKKLPVTFCGDYSAQIQYRCGRPILTPDSVMVYAPEYILDTLPSVSTIYRSYKNQSSSVNENLPLDIPIGIKTTPQKVNLKIPVEEYLEKKFPRINVLTADVPDSVKIRIFPTSVALRCLIDLNDYKLVTETDFHLEVSYNDIKSLNQMRLPIRVAEQPESATHVIVSPDSVEFIIEERIADDVNFEQQQPISSRQ